MSIVAWFAFGGIEAIAAGAIISGWKWHRSETSYGLADGDTRSSLELYGALNWSHSCPHCLAMGRVRTKQLNSIAEASGNNNGKVRLDGFISVLGFGRSRSNTMTLAHCDNCKLTWYC
jgi:hypothetical protein